MEAILQSIQTGIPVLLTHLFVVIAMLVVGIRVYLWATPYDEFKHLAKNNHAVGITLSSDILGLSIPLASCLAYSVSTLDIVLWGVVTVVIQLLLFFVLDYVVKNLPKRIEKNEIAPALVLASCKLASGIILAAAISG